MSTSVDFKSAPKGTYLIRTRHYTAQFFNTYTRRLNQLGPIVAAAARAKWGITYPHTRIIDMAGEGRVVLTGSVFKDSPAKESFLRQYVADDEQGGLPVDPTDFVRGTCRVDPADKLTLEDASGLIRLTAPPCVAAKLVTGTIVAVLGEEVADGSFCVADLVDAGLLPLKTYSPRAAATAPRYIGFLSGLRLDGEGALISATGPSPPAAYSLSLLSDFLAADISAVGPLANVAKSLGRLFVCGDLIARDTEWYEMRKVKISAHKASLGAISHADTVLADLSANVPIEVIPGVNDPSNVMLPQQPLHPAMLPLTARGRGCILGTNPHSTTLTASEGDSSWQCDLLIESGAAIEDALRYMGVVSSAHPPQEVEMDGCSKVTPVFSRESYVAAAEAALRSRCIAPTAPDTLPCHPSVGSDTDPLILTEMPHLFVVGNAPSFDTKLLTESPEAPSKCCRIVTVPIFAERQALVLVDLASPTLDAFELPFGHQESSTPASP